MNHKNLALHGMAAEFPTPEALLQGARKAKAAGFRDMDAYSPLPVDGLYDAIGGKRTLLPWITLAGGLLSGIGGFTLQVWIATVDYPVNVGGRPFLSWPSFVPVTFACVILGAALSTFIGLFALYRFPQPYHAIFNTPGFERASDNRYFLCIEATDPNFNAGETREFLESLNPESVSEVPV